MERTLIPTFETPSFSKRLKSMLGVDFYRLFHTPLFYIMVAISAIIPAPWCCPWAVWQVLTG